MIDTKTKRTLQRKEPHEICNGWLSYSAITDRIVFGDKSDTIDTPINQTAYLYPDFVKTFTPSYLSNDNTWGYAKNVLFSVINLYRDKDSQVWLYIRIEDIQ